MAVKDVSSLKWDRHEKLDLYDVDTDKAIEALDAAKEMEERVCHRLTRIDIYGGYILTTYPPKWKNVKS